MTPQAPWHAADTIEQMQRFNRTLAWLPRFRIRNRLAPTAIQTLLRAGQFAGMRSLSKHGLQARTRLGGLPHTPVPVRIIHPDGPSKGLVLDIHGGGWVIGNAQMNDDVNAALVKACHVTVVSVDYRLATTTPLQGLLDDCLSAARWLLESEDEAFAGLPVIVIGESAGAHLAAATLLSLKAWPDLLARIKGAVLYYGVYDLAGTPSVHSAGPDTLVLDGPGMVEALRRLTPDMSDQQRRSPPLSPLYGDLEGLPPALLFAGEIDPLRDDTRLMAERWSQVASAETHLLPAAPHGFLHFPVPLAQQVQAHTHAWVNQRLVG
ncbi:alpha/beta hydrolase [Enterobacterales bacterium AW_CKDN230030176-1A_HGKHYDSX7]